MIGLMRVGRRIEVEIAVIECRNQLIEYATSSSSRSSRVGCDGVTNRCIRRVWRACCDCVACSMFNSLYRCFDCALALYLHESSLSFTRELIESVSHRTKRKVVVQQHEVTKR